MALTGFLVPLTSVAYIMVKCGSAAICFHVPISFGTLLLSCLHTLALLGGKKTGQGQEDQGFCSLWLFSVLTQQARNIKIGLFGSNESLACGIY